MLRHYIMTRQERSQAANGRWFGTGAPLCGTGDAHFIGAHPDDTRPPSRVRVTCPACCNRSNLIMNRERAFAEWAPAAR